MGLYMYQFKNFIKSGAIFCCLLVVAGLQALHRPTSQQPMAPKLYGKMQPQARETFQQIKQEEESKRLAKEAALEAETQQLKSQISKQCYDLMMIMDSSEQEKSTDAIQTQ